MAGSDAVPIGSIPDLGEVPESMWAYVVRQDRFGDPATAFQLEQVATPSPGPGEVLVAVMAAGINFNNVWAARGVPIDVIATRQRQGASEDFHVGGSDASGIVYAVGEGVERAKVGDHVVVHPGYWDANDAWIAEGRDPMIAPSARIWGYETNYGSFGQFSICQEHQLMPKATQLSWEEAAAPSLVGTTAYRMLFGWEGHTVEAGDVVLVWGGSGGLGTQAIQLARHAGAVPVAVVSSPERGQACVELGAEGYVDRSEFDHWGVPPLWDDAAGQKAWTKSAREFGKRIWEVVGERKSPRIVFEHPGQATIATSAFVCDSGGMIVICAGTTGYTATVDLRYHWVRQKRLQGSHGTNDEQAYAYNDLIRQGAIDPVLADGAAAPFDQLPRIHRDMADGILPPGNSAVLVGSPEAGGGRS